MQARSHWSKHIPKTGIISITSLSKSVEVCLVIVIAIRYGFGVVDESSEVAMLVEQHSAAFGGGIVVFFLLGNQSTFQTST